MTEAEAQEIFKECISNSDIMRMATWLDNNEGQDAATAIDEEEYRRRLLDSVSISEDMKVFLEVVN